MPGSNSGRAQHPSPPGRSGLEDGSVLGSRVFIRRRHIACGSTWGFAPDRVGGARSGRVLDGGAVFALAACLLARARSPLGEVDVRPV